MISLDSNAQNLGYFSVVDPLSTSALKCLSVDLCNEAPDVARVVAETELHMSVVIFLIGTP